MLFKQITPVIALVATLFGFASAGDNPGPTCGAPFCARGLRVNMTEYMSARAAEAASASAAADAPATTAAPVYLPVV
jgi:hypothetical protein